MDTCLYCGDTDLSTAASYLAGLMTYGGWTFDYVPSHQPLSEDQVGQRRLYIFSDYPAGMVSESVQQAVLEQVRRGAGFLMIGGWESFHGSGGNWDGTALSAALPVHIQPDDDRRNFDQGALLLPAGGVDLFSSLPWYSHPPSVGGLNLVRPRADAIVILEAHPLRACCSPDRRWQLETEPPVPALVCGTYEQGRTAAFLPDVAPHWVGGLVDWGTGRVSAQAPAAAAIEVGDLYARLFLELLTYLAGGQHQR